MTLDGTARHTSSESIHREFRCTAGESAHDPHPITNRETFNCPPWFMNVHNVNVLGCLVRNALECICIPTETVVTMSTSEEPLPFVEARKPLLNAIPTHLLEHFEPTFVKYYNKYSAGRLATHQIPIERYRADPAKYTIAYGRERVSDEGINFSDLRCPVDGGEITVRAFERQESSQDPRPVYINFHGGGWVFGGLSTDFDYCKRIVRNLDCVVFDVDYRLSPEYKYPIPVEDCIKALSWVLILLSFHDRHKANS